MLKWSCVADLVLLALKSGLIRSIRDDAGPAAVRVSVWYIVWLHPVGNGDGRRCDGLPVPGR